MSSTSPDAAGADTPAGDLVSPVHSATPASPAPHRSLIHHANFRRLWVGDSFSQLGAQLTLLAIPILAVQALAATPWQMGLLNAAETAAFLVIGLPAGAWVDRMRKRRTMITADLVRATILAVVVATALTGHASMPLLIVAALGMSAATVFFDVTYQSFLPGLVGAEHLVEGNSKLQATQSVAQVAGPALGGLLLRMLATPLLILGTVVTYLVSAFAVGRIRLDEKVPDRADRRPLRTEIAEGLAFVLREPLLRRIVGTTGLSNLATGIGNAVFAIYALRTLGLGEAGLGTLFSASAVGGLLGAVASDRLARWIGEGRIIPIAALLGVPAYALTPLAVTLQHAGLAPLATMIAAGVLFFFAVVVYNIAQVSFRQRLCPPPLLGRMNASIRFLVWGPIPLGGLLGGWLGTSLGIVPALWVAAAGVALSALPVALSPMWRMRTLPRPSDPVAPPATAG